RNGNALAAREGCVCLVQHRQDFEASALALFPQSQRFSHRLLFAAKTSGLDSLLNEGALVGSQLDVHRFTWLTAPSRIHLATTWSLAVGGVTLRRVDVLRYEPGIRVN